jgi:hypothetical protein
MSATKGDLAKFQALFGAIPVHVKPPAVVFSPRSATK